jgi:hypothetical protein
MRHLHYEEVTSPQYGRRRNQHTHSTTTIEGVLNQPDVIIIISAIDIYEVTGSFHCQWYSQITNY